ncbi:hypothetical protein ACTXI9_16985 [Brachybacterium alimentarium]
MTTDAHIDSLRASLAHRGALIADLEQKMRTMSDTLDRIERTNYR